MAVSYISPRIYATTDAGAPAVGYKLYTYLTGTSTPATTYSDAGGLSANANPVVLNARGEAVVFLTSGTTYRFVLKTDADVSVWTQDSIVGATSSVLSSNVTVSGAAVVPDGPLNDVLDDNETRITTLEADVSTLQTSENPPPNMGSYKNLALSAGGTTANISVSCDSIILESSTLSKKYSTVSVTVSTSVSGVGGLDAGSISSSTWYSVWLVGKTDGTINGLLSTSATSPSMPTGYDYKARIGWIRTDSTANKYPLSFIQKGNKIRYVITGGGNLTSLPTLASTSASVGSWTAVATANFVPTTASTMAIVVSSGQQSAGGVAPNSVYSTPGFSTYDLIPPISWQGNGSGSSAFMRANGEIMLESSNIYYCQPTGSVSGNTYIKCYGWEDNL